MEQENGEEQSVTHVSHLHPLYLTNVQATDQQALPLCHACRLRCGGPAYRCAPCRYFLHTSCAQLGRTLRHPAHPAHPLALLLTPPYPDGAYACDACRGRSAGFAFHCSHCSFDLHLPCAATPQTLAHRSHPHPLALVFGRPDGPAGYTFICDLCRGGCDVSRWFYVCAACDFGGHIGCFASEALPKELYELHQQADRDQERVQEVGSLATLQRRQQASDATARLMRTAGQNAVALTANSNQYVWRWG